MRIVAKQTDDEGAKTRQAIKIDQAGIYSDLVVSQFEAVYDDVLARMNRERDGDDVTAVIEPVVFHKHDRTDVSVVGDFSFDIMKEQKKALRKELVDAVDIPVVPRDSVSMQDVSSTSVKSKLKIGDEPADEPPSKPPITLNDDQEKLCCMLYKHVRAILNHQMDPFLFPPKQLLLHISGGPGSGKTTLIKELQRRCKVYAMRIGSTQMKRLSPGMSNCAPTGEACKVLGNSSTTTRSLLSLNPKTSQISVGKTRVHHECLLNSGDKIQKPISCSARSTSKADFFKRESE